MWGMLLLAVAATPEVGEIKTFKDWVAGCDNGLLCQASAMMPPADAGVTLTVRRGPEGDAVPSVWLRIWDGELADVAPDGKPLHLKLSKNDDDAYVVDPADSMRLLDALRTAKVAEVLDSNGKPAGILSVDGASAALLYIDDQQHRLGTRGAFVDRGEKPDSSVPPPPALPVRYTVPGSAKPATKLSAAFIAKVRKDGDCPDETDPNLVSEDRLDATHSFASITLVCQSGAYNMISEDFIIPDGGSPVDAMFGEDSMDDEMLHYNIWWNPKERLLHSGFKGRGIGDCGGRQSYAWDGTRFNLVAVEGMSDCRGVRDFISLWRARVVER